MAVGSLLQFFTTRSHSEQKSIRGAPEYRYHVDQNNGAALTSTRIDILPGQKNAYNIFLSLVIVFLTISRKQPARQIIDTRPRKKNYHDHQGAVSNPPFQRFAKSWTQTHSSHRCSPPPCAPADY
jgi:hypothetical protein